MLTESFSPEKSDPKERAIARLNYLFHETELRISKVTTDANPIKVHLKQLQTTLIGCIAQAPKGLKINLLWEFTRDTHELINFAFLDYYIYFDVTPVHHVHKKLQEYYEKWTRLLAIAYGDRYQIKLTYCVIYIITDLMFGIFLVQMTSLARYSFGMIVGVALLTSTIGLKLNFNNTNYHVGDLANGLFQYQIVQQYVFFSHRKNSSLNQLYQHDAI